MTSPALLARLEARKADYERLRPGKDDLLRLLDESELPESVYNSNAIENSTLTLEDTERILLAVEVSRHMNLREVHEAQNLAKVTGYIRTKSVDLLSLEKILLLHKMLLSNIDEPIAGRFRGPGEYVRVGSHVAPAPDNIEPLLTNMLVRFESALSLNLVQRISYLHVEFERIHPFIDGNGRIGRVLINAALHRAGYPPIIVRNKGKEKYYAMLRQFDSSGKSTLFEAHLAVLILESLHRRITYLAGSEITLASARASSLGISVNVFLNYARRQSIPAFRERGAWKIAGDFVLPPQLCASPATLS